MSFTRMEKAELALIAGTVVAVGFLLRQSTDRR